MIHFACVATESKLYFPYLKQLLPDLKVLGFNTKWKGFIMKYELLTEHLKTLDDEDIICFVDAYDLLPTKNIGTLETKFIEFSKTHPNVKMIVGHDQASNFLHELMEEYVFGTIEGDRINSGQFIGYVKNIKVIVSSILNNTKIFRTDQMELTKYIKNHYDDFHIDKEKYFFHVATNPMQQSINANTDACFIHANGNGLLEDFLYVHHGIEIDRMHRLYNFVENFKGVVRKINIYKNYLFTSHNFSRLGNDIVQYIITFVFLLVKMIKCALNIEQIEN
jgi:hypothetical protein